MLARLKLRFTLATILIAALLLSIVMTAVILITGVEIRLEINRKIERSLDIGSSINFDTKVDNENLDCMLVAYYNGKYYTARSELYTEQEQSDLINLMLSTEDNSYFTYENKKFVWGERQIGENSIYALYDATAEFGAIIHTWRVNVIAYSGLLVVIAIIAWLLSSSVVRPVDNALEKQKDLIANASHELKTPITIIETDLTLAKSSIGDNPEAMKWLDGIESQAKRMNTLVKQMLELSKLESNVSVVVENVKISELIESMILEYEAGCFEKSIKLTYNIPSGIEINSDHEKMTKLVSILLNNAYKYTDDGGEIKVELETKKDNVVFSITNTGAGIPKEKISHIFERFYKVDESHTGESNSFGLGLAIAQSLVDSLCGWIKCESVENEYTKFIFSIPSNPTNMKKSDKPTNDKSTNADMTISFGTSESDIDDIN